MTKRLAYLTLVIVVILMAVGTLACGNPCGYSSYDGLCEDTERINAASTAAELNRQTMEPSATAAP